MWNSEINNGQEFLYKIFYQLLQTYKFQFIVNVYVRNNSSLNISPHTISLFAMIC